jgi:hypothetical protein
MYTAMHASFGGGIRVHLEIKIRAAKDVGSGKKEERDDLRNVRKDKRNKYGSLR